jgi:putative polymerase
MTGTIALTGEAAPAARRNWPAYAVLTAALGYNLPLAIINNHVMAVGRNTLIGVEVVLIGFALVISLQRWRPDMTRWILMIATFSALSLVMTLFRMGFDPKSLRDTLMIAAFIMLGMTTPLDSARWFLVALQVAITVLMLFEVTFPASYAAIVGSTDYFINTRGFSAEQFYGDIDLFGITRPDERYLLPFTGWIRASSIFLEPLSMGNYSSIAALLMILFWSSWSTRIRILMVLTWALITVGSDGRFALTSSVLIVVLAPLMRRLPVPLAMAYLPAAVLGARVLSQALAWNPLQDTFPGRVARGMKQLFKLDFAGAWGTLVPTQALADSGIAYLVMGQSLLGVAALQLFLYLQPHLRDPRQRLVFHGNAILFTTSILISISMLSIKTAALMWFYAGVVLALPAMPRGTPTPQVRYGMK